MTNAQFKKFMSYEETRPDTRPPVADGWAGAEMRVYTLFDSCSPTDRPTDGRMDKASYRDARTHLTSKGAVYTAFVAPSRPKSESVTDRPTDGPTNQPTDGRTHAHIESLRRD